MNLIPPAVLDMRVPAGHGGTSHLWLPLFLLWPLIWLLELVALAVAALYDLLMWLAGREYHHAARFLLTCFGLLGETRGLSVRVSDRHHHIDMTFV